MPFDECRAAFRSAGVADGPLHALEVGPDLFIRGDPGHGLAQGVRGQRVAGEGFPETQLHDAVCVGGLFGHLREADEGDAVVEGLIVEFIPAHERNARAWRSTAGCGKRGRTSIPGWDGRDRGSVQVPMVIATCQGPLPKASMQAR